MNREELKAEDFNYELPDHKIAKHPLKNRNGSKLLVYNNGEIQENTFYNLKDYLPKNSTLVFNNTRVIAARLIFTKSTGAKIEVFCLEPFESTVEQALSSTSTCTWQCIVGNLKRFKPEDTISIEIANTSLKANLIEKRDQDVIVQFSWNNGMDFSSIIDEAGKIPLPPYLNREVEATDKDTYQTVYAKKEGAVAAPTAGLHFTDEQLIDLQNCGHSVEYLTLHVGAGTFKPVKAEKLTDHEMHKERIIVGKSMLERLVQSDNIVPIGTTSLRSLESLYWLAVKIKSQGLNSVPSITQNDAYQLIYDWNWKQAYQFLIEFMNRHNLNQVDFHSALFIMKSYDWKVISGLITNFHQPKSTLLALVSSWIGDDWKVVYDYALNNDFRFLSYGDSSLLIR